MTLQNPAGIRVVHIHIHTTPMVLCSDPLTLRLSDDDDELLVLFSMIEILVSAIVVIVA